MQIATTPEARDTIRAAVLASMTDRAVALGWYGRDGRKLTKKGEDEALSYLVGVARGFELAEHPAANWLASLVFLASLRGAMSIFATKA